MLNKRKRRLTEQIRIRLHQEEVLVPNVEEYLYVLSMDDVNPEENNDDVILNSKRFELILDEIFD